MEHRNPRGGHPHPPETAPACTRARPSSGPCTPRHNLHTPTRFPGALPSALGAPAGEVTRGVASTHTRALSKNPGSWIAVVPHNITTISFFYAHLCVLSPLVGPPTLSSLKTSLVLAIPLSSHAGPLPTSRIFRTPLVLQIISSTSPLHSRGSTCHLHRHLSYPLRALRG